MTPVTNETVNNGCTNCLYWRTRPGADPCSKCAPPAWSEWRPVECSVAPDACQDLVAKALLPFEIIQLEKSTMSKNKYLTVDEVENLKAACEDSEERSVVRDLTDTGMKLDEVLKNKSAFDPNLHA